MWRSTSKIISKPINSSCHTASGVSWTTNYMQFLKVFNYEAYFWCVLFPYYKSRAPAKLCLPLYIEKDSLFQRPFCFRWLCRVLKYHQILPFKPKKKDFTPKYNRMPHLYTSQYCEELRMKTDFHCSKVPR